MHHIFVSYSRSDSDWVLALEDRLKLEGLDTWIDKRDIPTTLPWLEEVRDGIVEADLFLLCDSPAAANSASCRLENELAFLACKRSCVAEVGASIGDATAKIKKALKALDTPYRMRTELAVLARDWDRGGRRRTALAPSRTRRALMLGTVVEPTLDGVERRFLRASRRRSRTRVSVAGLVAAAILVGVSTVLAFGRANTRASDRNDALAAGYVAIREAIDRSAGDPYRALGEVAAFGGDDGFAHGNAISAALVHPVPDDAFTVPGGPRRFATPVVGDLVAVVGAHGRLWARAAAARSTRTATRTNGAPRLRTDGATGRLRFERRGRGGDVEVKRDGRLWRRFWFTELPGRLRLSPNGRELAAIVGNSVAIADLELGAVRHTLFGNSAPLRDLAWSRDGRRIWALSGRRAMSWPVRDGEVLIDDPSARFEALLASAAASNAWAVTSAGELREFEAGSGRIVRTRRVRDTIRSAGGASDGSVAALSGQRGVWIVPLSGGTPRLVRVADCRLGRPAFRNAKTFYLPCLGGALLTVSVAQARVVGRLDEWGKGGVYAAKVMPRSGTLLTSDPFARLFATSASGKTRQLFFSPCGGTITRIGVAQDDSTVALAGTGSGMFGCLRRGVLRGADPADPRGWVFDAVGDGSVDSGLGVATAVSSSGRTFATGYSDGTVVVHPTANIVPSLTIQNVVGEIREMYVTRSDDLLIATAAGIVQRMRLCDACISNRALANVARARAERSIEIGVAQLATP